MLDQGRQFSGASELQKRVVVGVIGAAVLISLVVFGGWIGICLITTVLSTAMIAEFSSMAFSLGDRLEKRYALLSLAWLVGLCNLIFSGAEFSLLAFCFITLFSYFLITADRHEEGHFFDHFKELMHSLFGILYLVFLPLFLTRVRASSDGVKWTLLFFLIVWAGDSAAYFAGKKFGRHKLYALISPKKTLEGSAGGLLAGVVIAVLFKVLFFRTMPWPATIFLPLVVGAFAQVGDLCESFLKRAYGKKDSGSVLPGHGGFLDRFDGVVFSVPVMYACMRVFGW